MPEVECDNCGELTHKKPSVIEDNDHVFCSQDCYFEFGRPDMQGENNPHYTGMVEIECENCGEAFEVHPYREDSARFCSKECLSGFMAGRSGEETPRYKGAKETFICENCGEEFEEFPYPGKNKYCSRSCYNEALEELVSGKDNPVWRGGYDNYYGPNWQEQRRKALKRDNYECQDCGLHTDEMEKSPDVHHKKRLGWFKEEYDSPMWYEKANDLENLVTLCPSCHMKREWSNGAIQ